FQNSTQAAAPGDRDLRLVYNMDRLVQTPHFRSYWIQRNTSSLREFASGLADLERTAGEYSERRLLLRSTPANRSTQLQARSGQLLARAPDDAGLYRLTARPTPTQALAWIQEKLFASTNLPGPRSKQAPGAIDSSESGSESDLETRIDEAPLI